MTTLSIVIQLRISVVCERLVLSGHLHSLYSARCLHRPHTSPLPAWSTPSPNYLLTLPPFFCSESCAFFHVKDTGPVDECVRPKQGPLLWEGCQGGRKNLGSGARWSVFKARLCRFLAV